MMIILHGEKQALKNPEGAVQNTYVNLKGISTREPTPPLGEGSSSSSTCKNLSRVDSLQLKAQLIEEKNLYIRPRTRLGAPSVNRKSFTEEDLKRFEHENDGFPLPRTKDELQEFDAQIKRKRSPSRNKLLTIGLLKAKLNKIQTPAKPKFLERLITGVGSKLSKSHNKINDVVAPGNIAEDSSSEAVKDVQAESTSCICPLSDNRPDSSPEYSDYEEIHLYEVPQSYAASHSEWDSPHSTPTSPKLSGIVRQRCNEFQKLNTDKPAPAQKILKDKNLMDCQMPKSMPSSPQNRAKHISDTIEKLTSSLAPVEQVKKTAVIKDEYLANATMAAGYVRAFVEKINQSNRVTSDGETVRESNGCTPGHSIPGSPCLRKGSASDEVIASKNRKNSSSSRKSVPRNGIVSLHDGKPEFLGKHSSMHREKTSSISDQGINTLSPEELFDHSWSESDTFEDDYSSNDDSCLEDAVAPLEYEEAPKPKDIRYKIVEELLKTERAYVTKLHLVDQVFHFRVIVENQVYNFFSADVIQQIFSNIKSIYQFHHDFMCPQLEKRMKNWNSEPRIGDLMKKNAPFLKLYSEYVKNFDNAMNLMNECTEKCPRFATIVKEIQQGPDCANLTLQHHMLEPIQRVPRYELLLKDYLKHLPENSPDRKDTEEALQKVAEAASHSNEAMNKIEKFRKLLDIHQRLGQSFDLISPTRELVKEGRVTKISARSGEKQERYLFLFNDLMLVCSELLGTYKIRASLNIDGMEVKEAEIPIAFYVRSKQKTIELLNDGPLEEPNGWYMSTSAVINEFNSRKQTMRALEQAQNLPDDDEVGKRAPTWVKDDAATSCMLCSNQFTTFRRRHHCRGCGNVVCAKCSSKKVPLSYDDNKLNRVCDKCFEVLDTTNLPKSNGDVSSDKKSVLQSKKKSSTNTENPQSGTTEVLTTTKLEKESVQKCKATDPSIISGYLHISSDNCKNWCRRWFAVHTSFVMYVFKGHQDGCALSTMPLPGYTVTEVDEKDTFVDRTHVFKLHHGVQQVHYFKAESDEQLKRWVQVLQKMVILELPESSPDSSTPSISSKEDEDYDGPDQESRKS